MNLSDSSRFWFIVKGKRKHPFSSFPFAHPLGRTSILCTYNSLSFLPERRTPRCQPRMTVCVLHGRSFFEGTGFFTSVFWTQANEGNLPQLSLCMHQQTVCPWLVQHLLFWAVAAMMVSIWKDFTELKIMVNTSQSLGLIPSLSILLFFWSLVHDVFFFFLQMKPDIYRNLLFVKNLSCRIHGPTRSGSGFAEWCKIPQ